MNKKIIAVIAVLVVIIGALVFILIKSKNNKEVFKLTDKYNSLEVTLKYPKDAGFTTDKFNEKYATTYPTASFRNVDQNYEVLLSYRNDSKEAYENNLEYAKKKDNYSEVEYNKIVGYKYNVDSFGRIEMVLKLKETETSYIVLSTVINKIDSDNKEISTTKIFNSKEFQEILETITFTDQVDGKFEVDGVLSENHKLIVKIIKAPNSEYNVSQYQDVIGGVMNSYIKKSDKSQYNNSGAYFRIEYYGNEGYYKDLASFQEFKETAYKVTYKDADLFGTPVKIETSDSTLDSKYTRWDSGIFEKDGKVYQFLYYIYSDVDNSIGEELVKNVLNNIEINE